MKRSFILSILLFLGNAFAVNAQEGGSASPSLQEPGGPTYHLFSVVSRDSMVEKLNQYGAMGYRFLDQTVAKGGAYTVIMEQAPPGTYQYVYAVGTLHKSKFQEDLNAQGARGFRYVHGTMGGGPSGGGMFSPPVCVGLMERASVADETYEYKIVMPMMQGSFAKDLANAAVAGFRPVQASSLAELAQLGGLPGDRNLVIAERSSRRTPQTGSVTNSYRLIGISQLKNRDRRIAEEMAEGYKILFTGYGTSGLHSEQSAFFALLERSPSTVGNADAREYKFLDAQVEGIEDKNIAAFVQQINDAAASGYRPLGTPISPTFHTDRWLKPHVRLSAVLERSDRRLEYRFATADDTPDLSRLLAELWKEGFRVVRSGLLSNQSAIVERELPVKESKAP